MRYRFLHLSPPRLTSSKINFLAVAWMVGTAFLLGNLATQAAVQPNILWITSEDNGVKWIGCYGGQNAQTPNIDQLATEGFR